jgi:hypothetical protein
MTADRVGITGSIALTLGLAISDSLAATSSGLAYSARAQQMCAGDAMRLCSSEIPNISRIIACMRRNKANVSPGCRAVMEQEDPASRPKPVQAAPVEPKPPTAARAEQTAQVRPKPVQVAPVEPKPAAAPPVAQAAPAEPKPVAAPPVVQPAAAGAKPAPAVDFEQMTVAASEQVRRPRVNPFRRIAVDQKPAASPPVAQPATEAKPADAAPAIIPTKPVQVAAVEQKPAVASPAAVKPVEAKPAPAARPAKVVRRKQKHQQVAAARYTPNETGGYERYIGMALPLMSLIMSQW